MKIAMMVRGYVPVPRPVDLIYAPIDLAVAIAEGLSQRGHQIDFFAPLGSHLKNAHVESLNLRQLASSEAEFRSLVTDPSLQGHIMPDLWDRYMANEMFSRAGRGKYDLLYFHHTEMALPLAHLKPNVPIVYTLNDPIYPWYKELFELYQTPNQYFISISNNQRRDAPDLQYAATVYNGIDTKLFAPSKEPHDNYLLIAGRIVPEKGFKEAVQVARQSGERLIIIGPVYPNMKGYFDQHIKPHLNEKILYLGSMEQSQLVCYYKKAKAFLAPLQWEEPFGLTFIEAMACGTPVISLNRGAAAEIIKHGETGFIVESLAEMIQAIGKIDGIDRAACHEHVKAHFSNSRMVEEYEAAFKKVLREQTSRQKVVRDLNVLKKHLLRLPRKLKDNLKGANSAQIAFPQFALEDDPKLTILPGEPPSAKKFNDL